MTGSRFRPPPDVPNDLEGIILWTLLALAVVLNLSERIWRVLVAQNS